MTLSQTDKRQILYIIKKFLEVNNINIANVPDVLNTPKPISIDELADKAFLITVRMVEEEEQPAEIPN
jgi:hypothetical protein